MRQILLKTEEQLIKEGWKEDAIGGLTKGFYVSVNRTMRKSLGKLVTLHPSGTYLQIEIDGGVFGFDRECEVGGRRFGEPTLRDIIDEMRKEINEGW